MPFVVSSFPKKKAAILAAFLFYSIKFRIAGLEEKTANFSDVEVLIYQDLLLWISGGNLTKKQSLEFRVQHYDVAHPARTGIEWDGRPSRAGPRAFEAGCEGGERDILLDILFLARYSVDSPLSLYTDLHRTIILSKPNTRAGPRAFEAGLSGIFFLTFFSWPGIQLIHRYPCIPIYTEPLFFLFAFKWFLNACKSPAPANSVLGCYCRVPQRGSWRSLSGANRPSLFPEMRDWARVTRSRCRPLMALLYRWGCPGS
jgi:hypothetical protein